MGAVPLNMYYDYLKQVEVYPSFEGSYPLSGKWACGSYRR